MKKILIFALALFFVPTFSLAYSIDSAGGDCTIFGTWNNSTCTLTQNIFDSISIDGSNIILDGNEHTITGNPQLYVGVSVNASNITVKNLTIQGFPYGISLGGFRAERTIVKNNTIIGPGTYGISASDADFSTFSGNIIKNFDEGFHFEYCSMHHTFSGNTIESNTLGAYFQGSTGIFTQNNFKNNTKNIENITHVFDCGGGFETLYQPLPIGGNYWSNNTTCEDVNSDGICDTAFIGAINSDGLNAYDNFPWVKENGWIATPPTTRTPVLFIPGTLGTEIWNGDELLWADINRMVFGIDRFSIFMNPLAFNSDGTPSDSSVSIGNVLDNPNGKFNYTSGLVSEFLSRGYSANTDFFLFPYDWRGDIKNNADVALKSKIDAILLQTGGGKIDVIAHSQGGLLLKQFLLDHPEYNSKIRKVVFLGTPNLGSPKSAQTLLEGDDLSVALKIGETKLLKLNPSEVKYISQNMPSIYEMLPSQEYFAHTSGYLGALSFPHEIVYDYNATKQKLLDSGLNSSLITRAENFHTSALDNFDFSNTGIEAWNIVGCNTATLSQTTDYGMGMHMIDYTAGDGTVPLISSMYLNGVNTLLELTAEHADMPSNLTVRAKVADILTGVNTERTGITQNVAECKPVSGRAISIHSPADLNVYDSQNRHLGPNADGSFDLEIPGATYDTIGEEKFAFLPDGETYTVNLVATGSGSMSFVSQKIENGTTVNTSAYFDIPISVGLTANTVLTEENTQTLVLHTNGTTKNILPSTGNGDILPDTISPQTTAVATGTLGQNNWYTSNVAVTLTATDFPISNASRVKETKYSLDKGVTLKTYDTTLPLLISTEGTTTIQYYSVDNEGNIETTNTLEVKIDKTAPEAKISVDATTKDLKIEGVDINPTTITKDASNTYTITDLAGHTTKLFFQKTFLGKLLTFAKLTGVQYNTAVKVTLPSSSFVYLWNPLVNPPILLSQTIVVNNTYGIEAVYDKKKKQTTVFLKKKGVQIEKQIFVGLRIPKLVMNNGTVGYEI